jgi:hypothetical protein
MKEVKLEFLQQILAGKKKVFKQKDVPSRFVPNWNELAPRIVYPQAIELHPDLKWYLPEPSGKK